MRDLNKDKEGKLNKTLATSRIGTHDLLIVGPALQHPIRNTPTTAQKIGLTTQF